MTRRITAGYQHYSGYRATNNWGDGDLLSDYAEGDVVEIPKDSPAWERMPHGVLCHDRRAWDTTRFRVVTAFSVGEGPDWYYRVAPVQGRATIWDEHSDRLHVLSDSDCDFTKGWRLITPARHRIGGDHAQTD